MSAKNAQKSRLVAFAILIIAFVMYGQSITGPIIANVIADCPQYDPALIAMIQTYPTIGIVISSLAYGALSRRFSSRTLLVAATILYAVGGVVPAFLGTNIPAILACRAVLGLGLGVYSSMPVALIAEHYEGNTGATLNGWVQVSASVGTIVFQTAAGYLTMIDWHLVMYLALLCIVACVVALAILPKNPKAPEQIATARKAHEEEKAARKALPFSQKYPPIVIAYFLEIFLFVGGIAILMMNAAVVVDMNGFGTPVDAATALSVHTACGVVAGLIFGALFKTCKEYVLVISAACATAAYLLLGFADNMTMVYLGSGLLGFAAPWTCASLFQLVGKYAAPVAAGMAVSVAVASQFLSQFLLNYWLAPLCGALGLSASGTDPFIVYSVVYAGLTVAFLVQAATGMKRRQNALMSNAAEAE